jgi:hypothetical protein
VGPQSTALADQPGYDREIFPHRGREIEYRSFIPHAVPSIAETGAGQPS